MLSVEYGALLAQWSREMGHVANVVGGVQEINLYYGDANRRFFPNPADYQQQAVSFLLEHALTTPSNFTGEDIVSRLTAEGTAQRWFFRTARSEPGPVAKAQTSAQPEQPVWLPEDRTGWPSGKWPF